MDNNAARGRETVQLKNLENDFAGAVANEFEDMLSISSYQLDQLVSVQSIWTYSHLGLRRILDVVDKGITCL